MADLEADGVEDIDAKTMELRICGPPDEISKAVYYLETWAPDLDHDALDVTIGPVFDASLEPADVLREFQEAMDDDV